MNAIPLRPTGERLKKRRIMNEQEVRERDTLNRDNTAPRLRARVLAGQNGHRGQA